MSKLSTLTEMVERTISEILKSIGTSIPGHIVSFDVNTQLAKVQIGIEFIDVQGQTFKLAPIVNVPVHFPGGDFVLEYQIDNGNEGLIIISQRCIDGWKEQGGIAPQTVLRKLDMQDALFIPGFRSKPNSITDFNNNGIRLRNKAGDHYIWLKNTGDILSENNNGAFLLKADGSTKGDNSNGVFELEVGGNFVVNGVTIDIVGNITTPANIAAANIAATAVGGSVTATNITATAEVSAPSILANSKELDNHSHPQGVDGGGDAQQNTGGNL